MSNIALSWAFKCHVGNASAKAVLVYLADRADDDGTAAYPKIATIVAVTELSERTVRTALKTLQERGFIRRGDQRYAWIGNGVLDRFLEDESLFGEFLRTPVSEGGVEPLVVEPPHVVVEVGA